MKTGGRVAAVCLEASMFRERPYRRASTFRQAAAEDLRSLPDGAYGPMDLSALPVSQMAASPAAHALWNAAPRPATAVA